jgi:hypothetical protein
MLYEGMDIIEVSDLPDNESTALIQRLSNVDLETFIDETNRYLGWRQEVFAEANRRGWDIEKMMAQK